MVLEELGLFPETLDQSLQVLCLNFGVNEAMAALKLTTSLRKSGIKADLYPSDAKIQKQFKYANNRNVPYVILIGEKKRKDNSFVVYNMDSGNQKSYHLINPDDFIQQLKNSPAIPVVKRPLGKLLWVSSLHVNKLQ